LKTGNKHPYAYKNLILCTQLAKLTIVMDPWPSTLPGRNSMKNASLWLIGLTVFLIAGLVQAGTVYYWTDENGVRHFSNTGAPTDAAEVGTTTEKVTAPAPDVEEQTEKAVEQEQDEIISNAPDSGTSTPTVRERAEQAERERIARQAEDERRRLEAEIGQVEQRSLSSTFTEGMRAARLDPLRQQLALLDADPAQYFRMKRDGAFAPGREQSSNRDRRGGRTGAMREGLQE
jgi:type IV secretory pathway VirB10-like protein